GNFIYTADFIHKATQCASKRWTVSSQDDISTLELFHWMSLFAPMQANLPLLQRELLHCQLLLDANASSPLDSSEIMLEMNEHGKRRTPDRYAEVRTAILPGCPLPAVKEAA
uniref:Uncharacterized protein n=1 Tax=Neogobius melanostomus TaxID=47308 RepID=A0A8C6URW2_9GOBI